MLSLKKKEKNKIMKNEEFDFWWRVEGKMYCQFPSESNTEFLERLTKAAWEMGMNNPIKKD